MTYFARDANVFVSYCNTREHPTRWRQYVDGLVRTYNAIGWGRVVDRAKLLSSRCDSFWVIHDREDRVLGGIRVVGPYSRVDRYACVKEMALSPDVDRLAAILRPCVERGLLEGKGAWVRPGRKNLGAVLSRCSHLGSRLRGAEFGVSVAHVKVAPSWASAGGKILSEVRPADFPFKGSRCCAILWDQGAFERAHPVQRQLADEEYRSLVASLASKARNNPKPRVFDLDARLLLDNIGVIPFFAGRADTNGKRRTLKRPPLRPSVSMLEARNTRGNNQRKIRSRL